jgi:glucosylceramidase
MDYKVAGVEINAVTVQNEVDSEQQGRMPQCLWGQQDEVAFAKDYLGPTLRKAGLRTKIWVLDHNYDLWGRALDELRGWPMSSMALRGMGTWGIRPR